jgi:predicted O-linked N-acetylglucosamine transferase (SPINDLY family)
VAASLLTAVGLPELIARDLGHYEQMAVRLASDPAELRGLRAKLAAQRTTWPLFDTPRFVGNLERAFTEMWATHAVGQAPRAFEVVEE